MKPQYFLFFLLLSGAVMAQESAPSAEVPRFQFGIEGSIGADYRTLFIMEDRVPSTAEVIFSTEGRDNLEKPKVGYRAGLVMRYNALNWLAVESGTYFQNMGYMKERYVHNAAPKRGYTYNLNYIHVPLKAKAFIGKGTVRFVAGLGASVGVLVQATRVSFSQLASEDNNARVNIYNDYRPLTGTAIVQLGVDVKVAPSMSLGLQPEFHYGMVPVKGEFIVDHMWSAGFCVSVLFGRTPTR